MITALRQRFAAIGPLRRICTGRRSRPRATRRPRPANGARLPKIWQTSPRRDDMIARRIPRRAATTCAAVVWIVCAGPVAGQSQPPDWQTLDARSAALYVKGDLPAAIAAAEAALAIARSPRESGRSLDRLGFLHYTSGNLAQGEKELRQSLQIRQGAFGADSLDYAETANDLAMVLRDTRHMEEAAALASQSVSIREHRLGGDDLLLAESLDTLGTIQGLSGDYTAAVSTFERAMMVHERRDPAARASEEYGTLCVNLAGTY